MKIDNPEISIRRSKDFEERSFSIKANAKAFDILSSKIYTDIPGAIIRELCTNAWDSHIEARKKDIPFDVHLPNLMEPFLRIRDYGVGMSHEDIMQLYTTYFESNKTDSNKVVGCLGIGSKSPFAYTDSFTVKAYKDKELRTYSMFKGEEGFPKVALLTRTSTDEQDGIEISIPILAKDFKTFEQAAQHSLSFFPNKPNVTGTSINLTRESIHAGNGWRIIKGYNSYLVMECVGYKLETHRLTYALRNVPMEIDAPIGSVDISANREELQYTEKTLKFIEAVVKRMKEELGREVNKRFDDLKTLWDAHLLWNNLITGSDSPLRSIPIAELGIKPTWKGKNVNTLPLPESTEINELKWRYGDKLTRTNKPYALRVDEKTQFVIIDTTYSLASARVRSLMKNSTEKYVTYTLEGPATTLNAWIKELGIENRTTYASALPKAIRSKSSSSSPYRPFFKVQMLKKPNYHTTSNHEYWSGVKLDPKQGGFYVEIFNSEIVDDNHPINIKPDKLLRIVSSLKETGILDDNAEVYGIKKAFVDKIVKEGNWINFLGWAQKKIRQESKKKEVIKTLAEYENASSFSMSSVELAVAKIMPNHEIHKILKDKEEKIEKGKKVKTIRSLMDSIGMNQEITEKVRSQKVTPFKERITAIRNKYPLINHIEVGYRSNTNIIAGRVKDYIELVDSKQTSKVS